MDMNCTEKAQNFPKCARALHNFLHSYDPARGIQIKLCKYARSMFSVGIEKQYRTVMR